MVRPFVPTAAFILCAAACSSTHETPSCVHGSLPCAATAPIATLNASDDAGAIVEEIENASVRFEQMFARQTPPTAVVLGGKASGETRRQLEENGFAVVLPWLTEADKREIMEATVRRQVLEQTADLPQAARDALVAKAVAKLAEARRGASSGPDSSDDTLSSVLSHELAHMWFKTLFVQAPDAKADGAVPSYGGWAPDWLDEAAAISVESDAMKARRRARFFALDPGERLGLWAFLSMEHPAAKAASSRAAMMNTGGGMTTMVMTGEEAEAFLAESGGAMAVNFYTQALVFTDFLQQASGDPLVLADIAEFLASGRTFQDWLQTGRGTLPSTIGALENAWTRYVESDGE